MEENFSKKVPEKKNSVFARVSQAMNDMITNLFKEKIPVWLSNSRWCIRGGQREPWEPGGGIVRDPDADTHRPPTGRPIPPAAELRWPPGSPIPTGDQSGAPKWEELAKYLNVIQWNDTTDEAIKA